MSWADQWDREPFNPPKLVNPTVEQFVKLNRAKIDAAVRNAYGNNCTPRDDEERRLWILNDEALYLWAKGEGVEV